ncbi:hypothetical protein LCGC14_1464470 [marine sediment metagenome]|uniref:SF4 helicase domain-containing protein n=1 Tax=marine sediment metagenome TaxID=412755 RepID=A0A0F9JEM6_9ZZZZ
MNQPPPPLNVRSLHELLNMQVPDIPFIVEPQLIAVGGSMFVFGDQELWKSWIAIELAFAVSTGTNWLGLYPTKKKRVLLIQTEQVELQYRKRIVKFAANINGNKPTDLFFATDLSIKFDNAFGLGILEARIQEYHPDLIIIDNLYHTITGAVADEAAVKHFIDGLGAFQQKYQTAFCIIHHPRKDQNSDNFDKSDIQNLYGSGTLLWWADTIAHVTKHPSFTDIRPMMQLEFQKVKNSEMGRPEPIRLRGDFETVRLTLH